MNVQPIIRPKFFQRRFLVDRKAQLAILAYTFFVAFITIVLCATFFSMIQMRAAQSDFTDQGQNSLVLASAAACFISMFLLSLLGFVISNRIAGPIYRLRLHMQSIAQGNELKQISFRKTDQFTDLAADYNRVLERLQKAESGTKLEVVPQEKAK